MCPVRNIFFDIATICLLCYRLKIVFFLQVTKVSVLLEGEEILPESLESTLILTNARFISPRQNYVYFEQQQKHGRQCGLCSLNNLYGYHAFAEHALIMVVSSLKTQHERLGLVDDTEYCNDTGNYNITVLLIVVKWVKMQDVGWVELNYLGNMDRNIDFLQRQRWLLIHQESVDKTTSGHYFCITKEHDLWWLKDSG